MTVTDKRREAVFLFGPPYRHLQAVDRADPVLPREGGWAMLWNLGGEEWHHGHPVATERLAGIPLVIILPSGNDELSVLRILRVIEQTRPQAVIPYHRVPGPGEIASVIRRPPTSLASGVTEYLEWRGVPLDPVTRKVIRRTVELSDRVRTIAALAKSLYMSRRALGRRLLNQGLPVPSHWLQVSRILRATIRLQNSESSLFRVASSLGYPDGFSLSNQMSRLLGIRPLEAREKLGWEWILETWLAREAQRGTIAADIMRGRPSIVDFGSPGLRETKLSEPPASASL
ncbi:MAG: hypothetical protein OXU69_17035 [Gemmatimonadota bacterium]|nr:hypothetical protein [Gemmatimonadota bacterium]MDE2986411.1 hypothetical protein [Gemmatimonadota bacterium]